MLNPSRVLTPIATLALVLAFATPPATAGHQYEQPVWITYNTTKLDLLVTGVNDPIIGAAIREAIDAWRTGIANLGPAWLASNLEIRAYFPAFDPLPPAGFQPNDIEIYVVPQGFFAASPGGNVCVATAPIGIFSAYEIAAHEIGHCLGLGHVFQHGQEYSPAFDIMGSGSVPGGKACPSNLNIQVLERVYGPLFGLPGGGTIVMSSGAYFQTAC